MQYKSDFSKFNFIILLIPVIMVLIINVFTENSFRMIILPAVGIFALLVFVFTLLFYTTYYEIQKEDLVISMFFYKTKIKISEIRILKHSNSLIKTNLYKPGFHHKGLEIMYNKYDDIFISPEKKEQFIAHLLLLNPQIEIKKK